jgi:hypothetical protein
VVIAACIGAAIAFAQQQQENNSLGPGTDTFVTAIR